MNTTLWILLAVYIGVLLILVIWHVKNEMSDNHKSTYNETILQLLIFVFWPITFLVALFVALADTLFEKQIDYLQEVWEHGGFKKRKEYLANEKAKGELIEAKEKAETEEYNRIKDAYLDGLLTRTELPRMTDGITKFEFSPQMGLAVNYHSEVRELVYVERERSEVLNSFFERHKGFQMYHMYRFVYLPHFCEQLNENGFVSYLHPDLNQQETDLLQFDSSYPMKHLIYPNDAKKIDHGMFFFYGERENHGATYTCGYYYPLHEGTDEDIIHQLDNIVKHAHDDHSIAMLYSKMKRPTIEEGSTKDYADELFMWVTHDNEVAILVDEIRERVNELRRKGMAERLLHTIIKEKPKLSRVLITKDYRIVLPDYHDMEIKMEPLVKAVYMLFLRHPEGIVFKHLPDYRIELTDIYKHIKPTIFTEKTRKSIEDVTNPCMNSINEKCARIRGAFIMQFDEELAKFYYIDGRRGEPKSIGIDRSLVEWEMELR